MMPTNPSDANRFEARISAWVDGEGEIRPEDLATPYGRQLWDSYHLAGDVLRSASLAVPVSPLFYARLSKAIDAEPPMVAQVPWWQRRALVAGLAAAALVAVLTWIVLPATSTRDTATPVLAASDTGVLRDYLEAHADVAGSGMIQRTAFTGARP